MFLGFFYFLILPPLYTTTATHFYIIRHIHLFLANCDLHTVHSLKALRVSTTCCISADICCNKLIATFRAVVSAVSSTKTSSDIDDSDDDEDKARSRSTIKHTYTYKCNYE